MPENSQIFVGSWLVQLRASTKGEQVQVPIKIQSFWTQCGEAECSEENFAEYGLRTQQGAIRLVCKVGKYCRWHSKCFGPVQKLGCIYSIVPIISPGGLKLLGFEIVIVHTSCLIETFWKQFWFTWFSSLKTWDEPGRLNRDLWGKIQDRKLKIKTKE